MREIGNIAMAATMTGVFAVMFWVQVAVIAKPCADTSNLSPSIRMFKAVY